MRDLTAILEKIDKYLTEKLELDSSNCLIVCSLLSKKYLDDIETELIYNDEDIDDEIETTEIPTEQVMENTEEFITPENSEVETENMEFEEVEEQRPIFVKNEPPRQQIQPEVKQPIVPKQPIPILNEKKLSEDLKKAEVKQQNMMPKKKVSLIRRPMQQPITKQQVDNDQLPEEEIIDEGDF